MPEVPLSNFRVNRVVPTIAGRLKGEKWLADIVQPDDLILCFGNLPPLFNLAGRVLVFVQNRYLVDNVKLSSFSLRTRLRLGLERLWFKWRISSVDEIIVQTPSMKNLLEVRVKGNTPVNVLPFLGDIAGYVRKASPSRLTQESVFDFLYVASGDPHKNHKQLVKAWCLLAKEGVFPSLRLTVDNRQFSELCDWIHRKSAQHHLNIENSGNLEDTQINELYSKAGALIFPSTLESFGLPLIVFFLATH